MKFHDFDILYDSMKKLNPSVVAEGVSQFYYNNMMLIKQKFGTREHRHAITAYNQAHSELFWHEAGRPYFKIFPNLLPMFMKTKLTVPGKYLHSPFRDFLIRLPENHQCKELMINDNELRTVLVSEATGEETEKDIFGPPIEHSHMFIIWMDFGEKHEGIPYFTYQVMKFHQEDTIEEALALQRTPDKIDRWTLTKGLDIGNEKINNCIRLVISVCFLATGADRIVEPDVLNKDLEKYIKAQRNRDVEQIQRLHHRAQNRGKKGWILGREITIPSRAGTKNSQATGQHLTYQHQRSAHFHVFRYGPNKSKWKVKWINQLTVRPDLPLPPVTQRGYKVK